MDMILKCYLAVWLSIWMVKDGKAQGHFWTVTTNSGPVRGMQVDVAELNNSVYLFRGIPYAEPPVGDLRFSKPKDIRPWSNTLNATTYGPICPQSPNYTGIVMSEDCLYLNVYVPVDVTVKKSVMIWIYGGGYTLGWSDKYDGSHLTIVGDVIVVTINYRLGYLGFLSTMDSASPGNYGLWDQHMAFKWVKNNIAAFGGNPSSITIFGESAGGASVSFQSLYPGNKGLFQSVISESGVATDSGVSQLPKQGTLFVAGKLGCNKTTSSELVSCMRGKSYFDILRVTSELYELQRFGSLHLLYMLGPVIDNDFIVDNPDKLLKNKSSEAFRFFQSLNLIVGNVDSEGSLFVSTAQYPIKKLKFNITEGMPTYFVCNDLIPTLVNIYFSNNSKISGKICEFYTIPNGNTTNMGAQAMSAANLFADLLYNAPSMAFLDAHQQSNNTYQFILSMPGSRGYGDPYPKWFKGQSHGAELSYLFSSLLQNISSMTKEQLTLSTEMLKYWTNFAKSGNPNGNNTKAYWSPYTSSLQSYMDLRIPLITQHHYLKERMNFWNQTIPVILNPITPVFNQSGKNYSSFVVVCIYTLVNILLCYN